MSSPFVGPAQRRRQETERGVSSAPSLWEYVAPTSSGNEPWDSLVRIARELLHRAGPRGVILGDVILTAEARGINCEAPPKEDKQKQQRHNSNFAHIMPEAGGVPTGDYRRSPVLRHHGNLHRVHVARGFEG